METMQAYLNSYPDLNLNAQQLTSKDICPNQYKHVSAFPAFDRELCPLCKRVYIRQLAQPQ